MNVNKHLERKKSLEWFIGFVEGDGSWQVQNTLTTSRCTFTINQKNPQVLYKIKRLLNFGKVTGPYVNKKYQNKYFRYSVTNIASIKTLIEICNGKFKLVKTKNRFKTFVDFYNLLPTVKNTPNMIEFKENSTLITLNDGWLSGFIDAEGCFSGCLKRRKGIVSGVTITFSLKQKSEKDIFTHLKILIGGSLSYTESNAISALKLEAAQDRQFIIDYLTEYPLKSNKLIAFNRFKKIQARLTDGKFKWRLESPRAKARLMRLVQNINV